MNSNRISPASIQNGSRTHSKWFRPVALSLVMFVGLASILAACESSGPSDKAKEVSGKTAWLVDTGGPICSSPAIAADGTVYVRSAGALHAYNEGGSLKWSHQREPGVETESSCASPIIRNDGSVFYENRLGGLSVVNPDGSTKWEYSDTPLIPRSVKGSAIGADGTIYITFKNRPRLLAISSSGEYVWGFDVGGAGDGLTSPVVGRDGTIYVGSGATSLQNDPANLYAVNPNGFVEWSYESGHLTKGSPIVDCDGTIYFSDSFNLNALEPDGTLKWSFRMTVEDILPFGITPVIGRDGVIFVSSRKNAGTGSPISSRAVCNQP